MYLAEIKIALSVSSNPTVLGKEESSLVGAIQRTGAINILQELCFQPTAAGATDFPDPSGPPAPFCPLCPRFLGFAEVNPGTSQRTRSEALLWHRTSHKRLTGPVFPPIEWQKTHTALLPGLRGEPIGGKCSKLKCWTNRNRCFHNWNLDSEVLDPFTVFSEEWVRHHDKAPGGIMKHLGKSDRK